ncbi:MAG: HAMP domain-containing protein [Burkholderiaceae bacterium]|jgi:signal transduction histidine kinase|nr:HAMP domain-containing protein [Burkholderiaceae bacterium]
MTPAGNPVARKLYLRIWLAVAGSVAVLSVLVGLAWHVADEQRERERERERQLPMPSREVLVRDASGALIGTAQAQPRRVRGRGLEFDIIFEDGNVVTIQRPAGTRANTDRSSTPWGWNSVLALLRPPYGFLWVLTLAGIMVMVGVFPIARRLTTRLEALQRGVQRWGEGDLSARVPDDNRQDEVADLSRRFNAAAERIQALMDSQAALLRSQKSLLANASHELRSPLARIRMALELGQGKAQSPAREEISRNIGELDQLVDEILLASRLDAREVDLGAVESIDLIGLLAEECARVNAALELCPGTAEVIASGVARLLRRVVRNLLENAVRHGRGSEVSAELGVADGWAVLHVNDRGPGVPLDQRERIFEPFYRLPGASERDGGAGLGLALVKSIAERHHGTVSCDNRDGGGARFTLRLPLAVATAQSD